MCRMMYAPLIQNAPRVVCERKNSRNQHKVDRILYMEQEKKKKNDGDNMKNETGWPIEWIQVTAAKIITKSQNKKKCNHK